MPQKNKFKILVVDKGQKLSKELVEKLGPGDYDVERVVGGITALKKAMPSPSNNGFSLYDLIIYDSQSTDLPFSTFLERIKVEDKYLPILVTGPEDTGLASRAVNAGALHYVSKSRQEMTDVLTDNILKRLTLSADVGEVTVIHIGNSASSFDDKYQGLNNLERAIEVCIEHKRLGGKLIITTGDGVFGEIQKRYLRHHETAGSVKKNFNERIKKAVEINAKNVYLLFKGAAQYISPDNFVQVSEELLKNKIALMPFAPVPIHRKHKISFGDSDVETLATAVFYEAEELIIIKDTDAVYSRDPLAGSLYGETGWRETQRTNRKIRSVSAKNLLDTDRRGAFDGHPNHLLEDNAIKYWSEHAHKLKVIYIVPIAPEKMYIKDSGSFSKASLELIHVVDASTEFQPLNEKLSAALDGRGYKITRE